MRQVQKVEVISMRSIIKEPLLHFILIGAALFLVFGLTSDRNSGSADEKIVVSAGRIAQLVNIYAKTWQRPPTQEELRGLIDDFVLEEIYYRQGVAMGIDRDDTVIRRRVRQKFEFLTDDAAAAVKPTDEELLAYLAANEGSFRRDPAYTFQQVYINPRRSDGDLEGYVAKRLAELRASETAERDGGLLPTSFDRASRRVVEGTFGLGFSGKLDGLTLGDWQGPIESGLGIHLIQVQSRMEGALPDLAEIREIVEREWVNERRFEMRRAMNEMLLENYEVVIDWPTGQTEGPSDAP